MTGGKHLRVSCNLYGGTVIAQLFCFSSFPGSINTVMNISSCQVDKLTALKTSRKHPSQHLLVQSQQWEHQNNIQT